MSGTSAEAPAPLRALLSFLEGWRFPVLALSALASFAAVLMAMVALPPQAGAAGAFAEEFRQWCFGWDPATGRMEWSFVLMALASPLALGAIIAALWQEPLRAAWRGPRGRVAALSLLGAAGVVASCGGLVALGSRETGELPFPAADLRTSLPMPELRLIDQDGEPYSPSAERGRVLLVTAIYAHCSGTCPMLLGGAREALAALSPEERADVVLVAVTLDPARDDPPALARLAAAHALRSPQARLLTGPVADVERALDALAIARTRDAATGLIDHPPVYLIVDRSGRLAYRLSLSERRKAWLPAALRALLAEPPGSA